MTVPGGFNCVGCGRRFVVNPEALEWRCPVCGEVTSYSREDVRALKEAQLDLPGRTDQELARAVRWHQHARRWNRRMLWAALLLAWFVPWWIVAIASHATAGFPLWLWPLVVLTPLGCVAVLVRGLVPPKVDVEQVARELGREKLEAALRSANERNWASLSPANRTLAWLWQGPFGFGAFAAVAVLAAGLGTSSLFFSPDRAAAGAALGILIGCAGIALLFLLYGFLDSLRRWTFAALARRWARALDYDRAVGRAPAIGVTAFLAFAAMGSVDLIFNPYGGHDGFWILLTVGAVPLFVAVVIVTLRVLYTAARLIWMRRRTSSG